MGLCLALLGGNSIFFYSQTTFPLLGSKSSGEKSGNISVSGLGGREGPVCMCVLMFAWCSSDGLMFSFIGTYHLWGSGQKYFCELQ